MGGAFGHFCAHIYNMTRLDQDNFLCKWCIRTEPISVYSGGDNFEIFIRWENHMYCIFKGQ